MPRVPYVADGTIRCRGDSIDLRVIGPRQSPAVAQKRVRVVVRWHASGQAAVPDQRLPLVALLIVSQPLLPAGRPARQVDQEAVESVTLLEIDQGSDQRVGVEPYFRRLMVAVEEEMPQGQLAHYRNPVRALVPHGAPDSFTGS